MRYYIMLFFFFVCNNMIVAQTDVVASKINQKDLKEVRDKYIEQQKQKRITKLIVDVKTILIDIIPSIVIKNRKVRYEWDRNPTKTIYVYQYLAQYDSVNFNTYTNLTIATFDTSFFLRNIKNDSKTVLNSDYTNLACIDTFNYNFAFIDDPIKADFILSSFNDDTQGHKKQLYIWLYPNLSECSLYHVEAEMPWEVDCYKTKILKEMMFTFNIKLDDLERMNKIRNSRY